MIEQFSIFDRGGTVLWSFQYATVKGSPLDFLVRSVLAEQRAGRSNVSLRDYMMEWSLENNLNLVFTVIYLRQFRPGYSELLLEKTKAKFVKLYGHDIRDDPQKPIDVSSFKREFDMILQKAQMESKGAKPRTELTVAPSNGGSGQAGDMPKVYSTEEQRVKRIESNTDASEDEEDSLISEPAADRTLSAEELKKKILAVNKKKSSKQRGKAPAPIETTRRKVMRQGDIDKRITRDQIAALDHSKATARSGEDDDDIRAKRIRDQFLNAAPSTYDIIPADLSEDDSDGDSASPVQDSKVMSFFRGLAGQKQLSRADLDPSLIRLRDQLIAKNVAVEIATQLCDSVGASLEGTKPGSFTTVSRMVRKAMNDALTRLLTQRQSSDILSHAKSVRQREQRPYVIVFCGVNGVGKSTSLAKICYYLQQHDMKVHIAACDTFRAGAVEQLKDHARCLNATLHQQGYDKDAAAVAKYAIDRARAEGADVVLVDTAGRMQDNEPLMRSLAKLVNVNQPDRVFFVGEALVGNDACDQLKKFNRALLTLIPPDSPARGIDGIVLTKFDTIDDKVGAAVSMVHEIGQPIVFVGVGQTYMDLRKVNTSALVRALLR
eukprot:Plantae.Rhodophyta-Purpureofilum_apyrenoidigerum.ctg2913.p1 GENE.Plantae.Rhodophyta-Purpureofilum_apyrenoidigerum.ctg2913~~Plantae.Rhodophyta-Purpureofilum_apyrenoidigerum.ctg2913.p1  ORF type:complete len:605 (+),score=125.87 Plantae.Rhodophyta-Purpureofilum_apyrenoidigerum.ctg2913:123-1937(+)